jgi:hypothetical protein
MTWSSADGDPDIYLAGGGARFKPGSPQYADRLWLNDGKGRFTEAPSGAIPSYLESESCIRTADFDGDGRTDILLAGRVVPGRYPEPASCRLLHNESGNGRVFFRDVTEENAPALLNAGLVNDAAWSDLDGDKDPDLLLTGEWMGIEAFRNDKGRLTRMKTGMDNRKGWWNALATADLDGDGDIDIVAGNHGLNGYFRASGNEPIRAYSNDYDGNGRQDLILSQYRAMTPHGPRKEYPVAMRDALAEELPQIKKSFPRYDAYGKASVDEVLKGFDRKGERVLEAGELASGWWENQGGMRFAFHPFPTVAQFAPIHAIAVTDLDGNGIPDLILGGNDGTMSPIPGRSDASYGTVLLGQGKGVFTPVSLQKSGWFETGDVRHMPPIRLADGSRVFVVSKLEGAVGLMRSSAGR